MNKIDEKEVLKIGAAQVITSVRQAVKELIENSIDADATIIEIKLIDHGTEIGVVDNGNGIDESDFELLGRRSTTSKLREFDELVEIDTFGFRGEALNSLCGTSDVTIITCTCPPLGHKLEFDRTGTVVKTTKMARNKGTTVKVANLFNNFPVRLHEFKKNSKREYSKAVDIVYQYCIAFPRIKFKLGHQLQREHVKVLETEGNGNTLSVFGEILGMQIAHGLIDFRGETELFSFFGWISKPKGLFGRADTERQYIYVNNKPVDIPLVLPG
jgi:DNA mismatch repair protein PMS2